MNDLTATHPQLPTKAEDAGCEVLHRHGVRLAGGYYIKRAVLERVLEGEKAV